MRRRLARLLHRAAFWLDPKPPTAFSLHIHVDGKEVARRVLAHAQAFDIDRDGRIPGARRAKRGDTLVSFAKRELPGSVYGWIDVVRLNPWLRDPRAPLEPGTRLRIS